MASLIHKDKIKIHKRDGGRYIHTNQMLLSLKTAAVLRFSTVMMLGKVFGHGDYDDDD